MRAAIFLDGGYFLQSLKHAQASVDFSRLADHFLGPLRRQMPMDLLRCYFYYAAPWMSATPTPDELRRMETFRTMADEWESYSRWQVRLGKLEKRRDGEEEWFEQKRVDVLLSCDLVRHAAAGHIQHAILVAGDSDFIPAVQAAKESGVTVTLWSGPTARVHKDLVTICDETHQFDWRQMPTTVVKEAPKKAQAPEAPKAPAAAPRPRRRR